MPSTITVKFKDDTQQTLVYESFAKAYHYPEFIQDPRKPDDPNALIPNPQTKEEFFTLKLQSYIEAIVNSKETEVDVGVQRQETKVRVATALSGLNVSKSAIAAGGTTL